MKNLLLLLLTVFMLNLNTNAQAPQLLNYQGVARNGFGNALPNRKMTLRLSILNGSNNGSVVYSETRTVTTNAGGLYTVLIGSGGTITSSGTISSINWQTDAKFLRVEVDPDAGSTFIDLGTTQLVSVPYAMSANIATPVGNAGGDLTGNYPNPSIANGAITTTKLADLAVTTLKISDQSITSNKIADASVTTSKIADASVTDAKIVAISGSKVTGNIAGNAANVTGTVAIANGGTGATTVASAKTNLGLNNVDNTSDLNKPISNATQTALDLKENLSNKSNATTLGTSDDLYPTQKAVKTYVDGQIIAGATPDATASIKGKIKLAGDLTGDAGTPEVAAGAITTIKLADASVTDTKIVGVSGAKVTGNIAGNAANVSGTVAIANGGTGATTASAAKTNLGLGNVDNTSDLNKPISTATQASLDLKAPINNPTFTGTFIASGITYPSSNGTYGQVLTTNGSGTMSWSTPTTAVTTVDAIAASSDANGAIISGSTLTLTPADATNGGVVTNGTQIFAGNKTFSKDLMVNGLTIGKGYNSNLYSIALGEAALSGSSNSGTNNTAVGYQTLKANTTGSYNTAMGSTALNANTTGYFNTAVGTLTLKANTTGISNTALGLRALESNTTGSYNSASGSWTLNQNTNGNYNTALGYETLFFNTSGSYNTSTGNSALNYNETGSYNTAIGRHALSNNITGNHNTAIGNKANVSSTNLENATAIGDSAIVTTSNTIQLGNTSVSNVKTSGTITAGAVTYPKVDGTANQALTTNGNGTLSWATVATAGVNNNITELTGLTTQKLITQIAGPINVASYSVGDVIYDQSSGDYYFFKKALSQTSSSFSNSSAGYAIFDFGRMVIRFTPTENKEIKSITLRINGSITNGVLSIYSGLSACAPRDCPTVGGSIATVNPATILGSSVMTSGANSEITFNFTSPIYVTANTNYYLTFSSDCTVGTGIMGSSGTDSNFSFSYGTCTIDQGIPAMKINYFNYSKL